jgi:hypothetical protein
MPKRFVKNAIGPFYVEDGMCIACAAPESVAPDLMNHVGPNETDSNHCYFEKQPESPEEMDQALSAMRVCCCGALRYGGNDPKLIQRLLDIGVEGDRIDAL